MRPLLLLLAACGFAACITDPTPGRSPYCYNVGDTSAYESITLGGIAIVCHWTVITVAECTDHHVTLYGQKDCVEGEKWPRP